jgi:hypothetical protein
MEGILNKKTIEAGEERLKFHIERSPLAITSKFYLPTLIAEKIEVFFPVNGVLQS